MEDSRVKQISNFTSGLVDIQIARHPLRSQVVIIFNETVYDIYKDATTEEVSRVNKYAIVERDKDRFYIQDWLGEEFLDDDLDKVPWLLTFTTTSLVRIPKHDDVIVIEGVKFTVARVKPINSRIKSVITVLVYPERTDSGNELIVHSVNVTKGGEAVSAYANIGEDLILEMIYGGVPIEYSIDKEDPSTGEWLEFNYKVKFNPSVNEPYFLFIRDTESTLKIAIP